MTPVVNEDAPRRPLRADAARNRERILVAAEEVFAREGLAVPVDTVAERAGVGVGTLYRHFPTKEALFEAIVVHRLDELLGLVRADVEAGTPGDGADVGARAPGDGAGPATHAPDPTDPTDRFFAFLDRVGEQVSLKHDLFDALGAAGVDLRSSYGDRVAELKRAVQVLYDRAVAGGGIRGDLDADQVMQLVMGVCHRADGSPADDETTRRLLRVVCDGLRVRG